MTVHCEGSRTLLEQQGERHEVEVELIRQGFRHQDFALHVLREAAPGAQHGPAGYAVTVVNVPNDRRRVYRGGSSGNWVEQFARDLSEGAFGVPAKANHPPPGSTRQAA